MSGKVDWTPDMLRRLRELRAAGISLQVCAEVIGVAYTTALLKARELDLAARLNSGRISGVERVGGHSDGGLQLR